VPDAGPAGWFFGCLLLWIICFPLYLIARPRLMRAAAQQKSALPAQTSFDDELRKLARLKDEGVITAQEFDAKKKSLLGL
jgi:hypothetical protein